MQDVYCVQCGSVSRHAENLSDSSRHLKNLGRGIPCKVRAETLATGRVGGIVFWYHHWLLCLILDLSRTLMFAFPKASLLLSMAKIMVSIISIAVYWMLRSWQGLQEESHSLP